MSSKTSSTPATLSITMFTVQDLSKRFGLHPKSVRERLNELGTLVEPYTERGRNNAIILSDSGLMIFDRLVQLEQDGHTMATAVQKMQKESSDQPETSLQPEGNLAPSDKSTELLIQELRTRITSLEEDKDFLKDQLEVAQGQIQAMLPAVSESRNHDEKLKQKMSRLQHLKSVITGGN